MRLPIFVAIGLVMCVALADEDEASRTVISTSPDKSTGVQASFEIDGTAGGGLRIVKLPGEEVLIDADELFMSGVAVEWAPDSKKVAFSGRAGGRYETIVVYALKDGAWTEIQSPEEATAEALQAAMDKVRKDNKIPTNACQRRIWDTWKLRKWIDADTAEVLVNSIRNDYPRDENGEVIPDNDGYEVSVYLLFKLKLKSDGTWEILEEKEIPENEFTGD